jgi:hypothetical protein
MLLRTNVQTLDVLSKLEGLWLNTRLEIMYAVATRYRIQYALYSLYRV